MEKLDALVHAAITDTAFCARLLASPREMLVAHDVEPTEELLEAIRGLDVETLQKLAVAFRTHPASV